MEIVCCPDTNYIMPCGVMLKSLCENNKDCEVRIHVIIDDDVVDSQKESLKRIVNAYQRKSIYFYNADKIYIKDFPALDNAFHIKRATYYRLYLTDILPQDIDKILYLDGDIIVENNLEELWNTDISGYSIGSVAEQETDNITTYNRLSYPHELGYFNAGVLLVNLSYWRNNSLSKKFTEFIEKYPERIKYHDQDVLNYVLRDSKLNLPLKYNVQPAFFYKKEYIMMDLQKYGQQIEEAKMNPYILHFSTKFKPWNEDFSHPLKNEFYKYQSMTEWNGQPLTKDYSSNRSIKAMLGDVLRLFRIMSPVKSHHTLFPNK